MRLIYLSDGWTIVLCFIVWAMIQVSAALICVNLPDSFFSPDSVFYKSHPFERNGHIYESIFRVRRWKHLIPDGAIVWKKKGFKKKKLSNFSQENLNRFLIESARGEMTHWLAIFPFWVFWLFTPPNVPWIMLGYAFAVNLPCIIVQRFNRPRVQHLLNIYI